MMRLIAILVATASVAHAGGATDSLLKSSQISASFTSYNAPTVAQAIVAAHSSSATFAGNPAANDELIARCAYSGTGTHISAAAGWTLAYESLAGAAQDGYGLVYRTSPGGTATFTPCAAASAVVIWDITTSTNVWASLFLTHVEALNGPVTGLTVTVTYPGALVLGSAGTCSTATGAVGVTSLTGNGAVLSGLYNASASCSIGGSYVALSNTFGATATVTSTLTQGAVGSTETDAIVLIN